MGGRAERADLRGRGGSPGNLAVPRVVDALHEQPWATAALAFAVALLHSPAGGVAFDTVWGEDGRFYEDALNSGLRSVGRTHVGYLHVVPRLVASVATFFPVVTVPVLFAVASALISAFCVAYVASDQARDDLGICAQTVVAFALVCLPIGTAEVFGNLANLQQIFWPTALWVLLAGQRSGPRLVVGATLCAAAALTSPLFFILVVVAALRWRAAPVLAATTAAAGVVQGAAILAAFGERDQMESGTINPLTAARAFVRHVPAAIVDDHNRTLVLKIASLAVVALCLACGLLRRRAAGVVALVGIAYVYWYTSTGFGLGLAPRHVMVPALLVLCASAYATEGIDRRPLALVVLACWISAYGLSGLRTSGPSWTDGVEAASGCVGEAQLPIAPHWGYVTIECSRL
jgi:hypothetical protein